MGESEGEISRPGGRLMLADYLALLDRVTPFIAQAGIEQPDRCRRLLAIARNETALNPDSCYAEVELSPPRLGSVDAALRFGQLRMEVERACRLLRWDLECILATSERRNVPTRP